MSISLPKILFFVKTWVFENFFIECLSKMIKLPYLPENHEIFYVAPKNKYMLMAKEVAKNLSMDKAHPTGAVIVKRNKILGKGANGSLYHDKYGCERKKQKIPTGQSYELCPGCSPKNHAEQKAIKNMMDNNKYKEGADLYLWGHWWCCKSCWDAMIEAKINKVFLEDLAWENFR